MRIYFLIINLLLLFLILNCGSQLFSPCCSVPIPTYSLTSSPCCLNCPTPLPTPTPDPYKEYRNLEVYITGGEPEFEDLLKFGAAKFKIIECPIFCEELNLKDIKLDLSKVTDIAVTKDGTKVYMVSKRIFPEESSHSVGEICLSYRKKPIMKRGYIYTINNKKEIDVLKVNNTPPLSCQLGEDIEIDNKNNIYIVDNPKQRIYKIDGETNITQLIELKEKSKYTYDMAFPTGNQSWEDLIPYLEGPYNLYIEGETIYFVMESPSVNAESIIKKITPNGQVQNVYEDFNGHFSKTFISIYQEKIYIGFSDIEGKGIINSREIGTITKSRVNSKGEIYYTDKTKHCIWKIIPYKELTMFAGNGSAGFKDGKGQDSQFNTPTVIDIDGQDNIYVVDSENKAIRKITPDGVVSTFYVQDSPQSISISAIQRLKL